MINEFKTKRYKLCILILICYIILLHLVLIFHKNQINENINVINSQAEDILNQASTIEYQSEQIAQQQLIINDLYPEFLSYIPDTLPVASVKISSYYGYRTNPENTFHHAIDFEGNYKDLIYAAGSGTVIEAGWDGSYGYKVTIDHGNGYKTIYAHCSVLLVEVGQNVTKSEEIACIGSTGYATGPHLHFELLYNNVNVNPLSVVVNELELEQ